MTIITNLPQQPPSYPTASDLPGGAAPGAVAAVISPISIYVNDGSAWQEISGGGGGGGVTELTGTADQVLVNGGSGIPVTGSILLALPQSIATTSSVQFGQFGVGAAPQTDLDLSISRAGGTVSSRSRNTNTTANSDAAFILQTSNGSPYISYVNNLTNYFCVGLDANASFRFKFSGAGSLGTNDVMSMDTASVAINNQLVIGSITPQGNTQLTLNPTGQYGIFASSTMSLASANLYGIRLNNIYSPSTAFSTHGYAFTGVFNAVSGRTIPNAYAFYSDITLSAAGGTVTSTYNFYAGGGSSTASTATNVYGFYNLALTFGTNRYGAYHTAPSGGSIAIACYTDNLSVGYNVTPPASGAIISGSVGIGTSGPSSSSKVQIVTTGTYNTWLSGTQTTDDGANTIGLIITSILAPATNSRSTYAMYLNPTFRAASAQTVNAAAALYINQSFSGNSGTVTNAYSALILGGTAGGTITNGYGMYIQAVGFATSRWGLYVEAPTGGSTNYGYQLMGQGSFNTSPGNNSVISMGSGAFTRTLYVTGTQAPASGPAHAIQFEYTVAPTAGNSAFTMTINTSFQSPAGGLNICAGYYANIACTGSGTITEASSVYVDSGVVAGPTLTTGFGIQVRPVTYGSTRIGLYVATPTGGVTANIGYQLFGQGAFNGAVNSTSLMTINSGSSYNRSVYITGTLSPGASAIHAFRMDVNITPPAASNGFAMHINPTITSGAGGLAVCAAIYASYVLAGSGTISESAGVYVDTCDDSVAANATIHSGLKINSQNAGVTRYGLYVAAQSGGTTNVCAYFGGPSQYGTATSGGGSALLGANSPAVTNTAPYVWITAIAPDGSTIYIPAWK